MVRVFRILEPGTEYAGNFLLLLFLLGTILLTANIIGFNAFRPEHEDRAFEYLFTLPLTKSKILAYKLIPRILTLALLLSVYALVSSSMIGKLNPVKGPLFFLIDPRFFPVVVNVFFWSGFFISIFEMKNWVALVTVLTFQSLAAAPAIVHTVLNPIYPEVWSVVGRNGVSFTVGSIIIILVLGGCSASTFMTMDLRSLTASSRLFALRTLGPLGIICAYGSLIILKWIIQKWL
ncbi:MAG: hypothetical protein OEW05_03130 [Candidatus Aminicenantes bacterium]|nr:hypothetical protein [Candidatus Aminicenantes bacterium]